MINIALGNGACSRTERRRPAMGITRLLINLARSRIVLTFAVTHPYALLKCTYVIHAAISCMLLLLVKVN